MSNRAKDISLNLSFVYSSEVEKAVTKITTTKHPELIRQVSLEQKANKKDSGNSSTMLKNNQQSKKGKHETAQPTQDSQVVPPLPKEEWEIAGIEGIYGELEELGQLETVVEQTEALQNNPGKKSKEEKTKDKTPRS